VRADGTRVSLALLPTARVPLSEGNAWAGEGVVFARLLGSPRASVGLGPRVRLMNGGSDELDAIATPAPGDDCSVDVDLAARGEAGLILRAASARGGFQGASVVLTTPLGASPKASLRLRAGAGPETELAPSMAVEGGSPFHLHVVVKGDTIDASVGTGNAKLTGKLPAILAHGDIALRVGKDAALEATGWRVRR